MVHESKEALNIFEDMMEEQIISTEDADLKTRDGASSRCTRDGTRRP